MKFKVGDKVVAKHLPGKIYTIEKIGSRYYYVGIGDEGQPLTISFEKEWQFELYKPKKLGWFRRMFKKGK